MLDIKDIRNNPEQIKKASKDKNFPINIQKILELDESIRPLQQNLEKLQALRNKKSKEIKSLPQQEQKECIKLVQSIKKDMETLQSSVRQKKADLHQELLKVPQPAREDVPLGKDDRSNQEVYTWGTPPKFDFPLKDHIQLGTDHKMFDIERGVKIAGSRSYVLTGKGTILERALMNFAFDYLVQRGFLPMSVPILVNKEAMEGTGYFPLGKDQAYFIEKDQLALIGTSEVSLCSLFGNEILKEKDLPIRMMSQSTCFRREAGTYGKDTKGLYRVHQFQKIEMVIFGHKDLEETDQLHDELVEYAEGILKELELPFRKVYVCAGDLGQGQVRKHDLETWMPSRKSYSETHSCSTFYDFQSRRLNIRYKDKIGQNQFVYTLNNTACASPRILIPFLENHQTKDGHIRIPKSLQPYLQGQTEIKA